MRRPAAWALKRPRSGHVEAIRGGTRLNETGKFERSRERLYVGLSRARGQVVGCGDPDFIREVGGPYLVRRLNVSST